MDEAMGSSSQGAEADLGGEGKAAAASFGDATGASFGDAAAAIFGDDDAWTASTDARCSLNHSCLFSLSCATNLLPYSPALQS